MTALTARRTNFKEIAKRNVSPEPVINRSGFGQYHSRQRIIDETYPELSSMDQEKKHKVKLRYKTLLPATIEDASEDEELTTTISNCLSSTRRNIEGRSPYVLPPEELFQHNIFENRDFFSHSLTSPKIERRSSRQSRTTMKANTGISRGFNDLIMRNKRSHSLFGERSSSSNFDSLPSDFLNLPPIPETVPMRKISENDELNLDDKE